MKLAIEDYKGLTYEEIAELKTELQKLIEDFASKGQVVFMDICQLARVSEYVLNLGISFISDNSI